MPRKICPFLIPAFLFLSIASGYAEETMEIRIGISVNPRTAPLLVADHEGYFKEQGLNVVVRRFDSGKAAMDAMLKDDNLDMVTAAQTPVVFNSFSYNNFTIIGCMVTSDFDVKILARKDRGIINYKDLQGKKIGLTKKSAGHFFLHQYLIQAGMRDSAVQIEDIPTSQLGQALVDGQVDAISSWEPYVYNARKVLGDNTILLSGKGFFREDFYLIANKTFLGNNQTTVKRFLKAIQKAEEFIQNDKEKSVDIVSRTTAIDSEFLTSVWENYVFELTLDQAVIISLEDQARWAIKSGHVDKTMPDFLDFISLDELEEVRPEGVRLNI